MQAVASSKAAETEIQAGYIMAMRNPRNEANALVAIVQTCRNPRFAAKAMYAKPVSGKDVIGPSIRLAEEMCRQWGNMDMQLFTVYEDDFKRIVRVVVKDLQTNTRYAQEVPIEKTIERKSKFKREGDLIRERTNTQGDRIFVLRATEDELQTKQAAGASKAIRNNILRLIPDHIQQEAIEVVNETKRNKVQADPEGEKRKIMNRFGALGVKPSDMEEYLDHPVEQISVDELADLGAIVTTIENGEAKWSDYLGRDTATQKKPERTRASLDEGFTPGDPATHTNPGDALGAARNPDLSPAQERAMQANMEMVEDAERRAGLTDQPTPEHQWKLIETQVNSLLAQTGGRKRYNEILKTFKVTDASQVSPAQRGFFLKTLRETNVEKP